VGQRLAAIPGIGSTSGNFEGFERIGQRQLSTNSRLLTSVVYLVALAITKSKQEERPHLN
jgi:hypothetical protein